MTSSFSNHPSGISDPLFDPNTGLYSFQKFFDYLETILSNSRALGMIYINAQDLRKIEYDYGQHLYNEILRTVVLELNQIKSELLPEEDILASRNVNDEVFLIFLNDRRDEYQSFLNSAKLKTTVETLISRLNMRILEVTFAYTRKVLKVDVGYTYMVYNPLLSRERTIYRLIDAAKSASQLNGEKFLHDLRETLKDVIIAENIRTLYQPIFELETKSIIGFEALSRGPANSPIESPLMLFTVAEKTNMSFELDKLCRKKSLENASGLAPHHLLFVNTFPATLHDPEFRGERLQRMLQSLNLNPRNIIFEITERFAIENYEIFRKEQSEYAETGFAMAIDDVGSGYGSLEAIANLKPEYLKIDMSIIRGIHTNTVKQEILKVIVDLAKQIRSKIITEGIETEEEFEILRTMGIQFGQGYWLSRPLPSPLIKSDAFVGGQRA